MSCRTSHRSHHNQLLPLRHQVTVKLRRNTPHGHVPSRSSAICQHMPNKQKTDLTGRMRRQTTRFDVSSNPNSIATSHDHMVIVIMDWSDRLRLHYSHLKWGELACLGFVVIMSLWDFNSSVTWSHNWLCYVSIRLQF